MRFLCLGEAMAIGVVDGDLARTARIGVGGAELNVALALAHVGHTVTFASRLGNDPFGRLVEQELKQAGVHGLLEWDDAARTAFCLRELTPLERRVVYYRADSAGSHLPSIPSLHDAVRRAGYLHLSGITAALQPRNASDLVDLIRYARHVGCQVSLDVNFREALWSRSVAGPVLLSLARESDLVFAGADEAECLWGVRSATDLHELVVVPELVRKDSDHLRVDVVRDGEVSSIGVPAVAVVDSVGAGDAFAAGYLAGGVRGLDVADQVLLAHTFAAEVMTTPDDALSSAGVRRALAMRW
jgi:2-dehydro-3-deoxygluconokinase